MERGLKIVTVFGSSRPQAGDADYQEARSLGAALARRGFAVCSGGYGGVMEGVSRGAKEAGGHVLAVTAEFFRRRANAWVDEEICARTWEERLFELVRCGDAYVACKGGTGTLVELATVWEMLNKAVMKRKPFVALGEFWRPVIDRVREVERGGASGWAEADDEMVHVLLTVEEAGDFLAEQLR